jgi:hypothetical protein
MTQRRVTSRRHHLRRTTKGVVPVVRHPMRFNSERIVPKKYKGKDRVYLKANVMNTYRYHKRYPPYTKSVVLETLRDEISADTSHDTNYFKEVDGGLRITFPHKDIKSMSEKIYAKTKIE